MFSKLIHMWKCFRGSHDWELVSSDYFDPHKMEDIGFDRCFKYGRDVVFKCKWCPIEHKERRFGFSVGTGSSVSFFGRDDWTVVKTEGRWQ